MNRRKIQKLIEVFYQQPFKIFYVNSLDGKTFSPPFGLFVSLGIGTTEFTLEKIKNVIKNTYPETNPVIAELVSIRKEGEFLNKISSGTGNPPQQYRIMETSDLNLLSKEDAEATLRGLREQITNSDNPSEDLLVTTQKLQECIERVDEQGWDSHKIQYQGGSYRIFHLISNYRREGDVEYRIGIYLIT